MMLEAVIPDAVHVSRLVSHHGIQEDRPSKTLFEFVRVVVSLSLAGHKDGNTIEAK